MEAITVLNLDKKSAQEVFDFVVNHLLTQNKRAIDESKGYCSYRLEGLKCAAGCLISDDLYTPSIEGMAWPSAIKKCKWTDAHCQLIGALQRIHDVYPPTTWKDRLKELALEHSLQFNEPVPK